MRSLCKLCCLVLVFAGLASCSTPSKMMYLKDMAYGKDYPAPPAPELIIQADDCLGILVSSESPELAAPFNILASGTGGNGIASYRYMVDREGNIDFPVLGTLNVAGKTLKQIKEQIADEIREKGYIREPIVLVTLDNFTVTVVGKTNNKILPVEGNSINLLQVIASTGDLTAQSNIKDVMVVRTENGVRRSYSVNLQSKDLFDSPVFYLKQQDVVYIKPRGRGLSSGGQTAMIFVNTGLSVLTIISNFILWSTR